MSNPKRYATALAFALAVPGAIPPNYTVELHAHLFMKEGMTWAFRGDFNGPLKATSWKDKFSSTANPESLEASGLGIVVAALYAHPLFTLGIKGAIQDQVELARRFVASHPNWIIARSPQEAREALTHGKRVMILALEGAAGILDEEDDLKRFIDEDGIRIVTLLHLTDDQFGGVAFLGGFKSLSTPFALLKNLFKRSHDEDGVSTNDYGLTLAGKKLAQDLIDRHVWIDLAHASDTSSRDLRAMMRAGGQPLLYTHTVLRRYRRTERGIPDFAIAEVAASGGIVGLMPSAEFLQGTPTEDPACAGTVRALARQYEDLAKVLPATSIDLGSDYNGGLTHLAPSAGACATGTSLDQEAGLWNIGQVPDIWIALKKAGAPTPEPLSGDVEAFLAAWEKVMPTHGP